MLCSFSVSKFSHLFYLLAYSFHEVSFVLIFFFVSEAHNATLRSAHLSCMVACPESCKNTSIDGVTTNKEFHTVSETVF